MVKEIEESLVYSFFILRGVSGSGKSMSLLALLQYFRRHDTIIPVLVTDSSNQCMTERLQTSLLQMYEGKNYLISQAYLCTSIWRHVEIAKKV